MTWHPLFHQDENRVLVAVGPRIFIQATAVGALVWGGFNLVMGIVWMQEHLLNAVLFALGLVMAGAGLAALLRPHRHLLLGQALAALALLAWNVYVVFTHPLEEGGFDLGQLFWPAVAAVGLIAMWVKLGPLAALITSVPAGTVKTIKAKVKAIMKLKPKRDEDLVLLAGGLFRLKCEGDEAIVVGQGGIRAFMASRAQLRELIADPAARKLKLVVDHPLGRLRLVADRKHSERLRRLLELDRAAPVPDAPPAEPTSTSVPDEDELPARHDD